MLLATTGKVVRWYAFDISKPINESCFTVIDKLDLKLVPKAANKKTAQLWVESMGLKTLRYVKL